MVPVSTVLLADVAGYFDGLDDYRAGRLEAWLTRFAAATTTAAVAGRDLADALGALRTHWLAAVRPRRGSAVAALVEVLLRRPVVDIETLRDLLGDGAPPADKNIYAALDRLETAGVLAEITGGARNRVWAATGVLDLLDGVQARLGRRTPHLP